MNLESNHQQKSSQLYLAFMKCSYLHRKLENLAPSIMVGHDFVNDTFLAFLSHTTSGQKHAATKYLSFFLSACLESRELRPPPQILFCVCLPAPFSLFMVVSASERSSCGGGD